MNLIKPIVLISLFCCVVFLIYIIVYKSHNLSTSKITTPDQALAELVQGNKEYTSFWNFFTRAKRKSVAITQRPFAIVLSCSDSRVPTEIIFNQLDLGSLFIIRNAGNVADGVVLGSIEFGVQHLGALLIIVLGHERCGAVTATIDEILQKNPERSGHIKDIINAISPAARNIINKHNIKKSHIAEDLKIKVINETVKENVRLVIESLSENSEIIRNAINFKKIKIVGAFYDLDDGNVQIIN